VIVVVLLILLLWAAHRAWGGLLQLAGHPGLRDSYLITGIGVTVGYHRLFTHRSFQDDALDARAAGDLGWRQWRAR
jgi:fatty-acid desaturase